MMGQKKVEIFLVKIRKSLAKQFLEIALMYYLNIQTFFNKPDEDLRLILMEASESPPDEV